MGLIEGLEERLEREYISLHDFLWHISELNDEPIQDICTFLIHHGFENKVRIYLNMPWYHMEESTENNKKSLLDTLMNIESADIVLDEELNEHNRNTEELIGILTSEANYAKIYFEKKELLSLSFLKDLLHFDDIPPLADNDSEQQSPSFLPDPLSYDELLAEKERLVTEIWKLLEQRDTATELLKTEQQEKNLLKEENAQLHAKIAELSAQHNQTGESLTDNNKELPHNSQMGVARLIYTLLSELKFDFNSHKGKENEVIVQASEVLGVSVSPNFVAKWIKLAREAKNDK